MSGAIILWVALGGALGSVLRYAMILLMKPATSYPFPLAIMAVNVLGCFCIGLVARKIPVLVTESHQLSVKAFLITGVLGGFTTFSSFALEAGQLLEKEQSFWAIIYIFSTMFIGLAAFCVAYFR